MASSYRLVLVSNIGQLNSTIETAIANGEMPLGRPDFLDHYYALVVGEDSAVTYESYEVVIAPDVRTLNTQVQYKLSGDPALSALGAPFSMRGRYAQVVVSGMSGSDDGDEPPPTQVTSDDITDATDVGRDVLTATDAAAARAAIGAGTGNSDLTIGTTASTAKAGNWVPPPAAAVTDAGDETEVFAQFNALLASLRAAGVVSE